MQISPESARIALLIESSRGYGRNLLLGVAAFARTHGPWSIYRHERALGDAVPDWLQRWDGDGIIARIESEQLAEYLINSDSRLLNNRTATAKQEQLARLAFRSGSVLAVGSSCLLRKRVTMKGTIEVMIHFGCLS